VTGFEGRPPPPQGVAEAFDNLEEKFSATGGKQSGDGCAKFSFSIKKFF